MCSLDYCIYIPRHPWFWDDVVCMYVCKYRGKGSQGGGGYPKMVSMVWHGMVWHGMDREGLMVYT